MTNQLYPTLNRVVPSWADIQTTITPVGASVIRTIDYAAIKLSSKVEVGKQYGASGGRLMGRTTGSKTDEASATYYRSGLRTLIKGLVGAAPTRGNQSLLSLVHFDVLIQHSVPNDTEIYVCKAKGVRLVGWDLSMAEGNDADKVEIGWSIMEFVHIIDGKEVVLL